MFVIYLEQIDGQLGDHSWKSALPMLDRSNNKDGEIKGKVVHINRRERGKYKKESSVRG